MVREQLKIAIGSDHAGFWLKERIKAYLQDEGILVTDYGAESDRGADYPDHVHPVAAGVEAGDFHYGIIMCGSGNGVSMTANKHPGVRAALSWQPEIARLARAHNDANILAFPARYIEEGPALEAVRLFLDTEFEGGRHLQRVNKIRIQ